MEEVICGDALSRCHCVMPAGHLTPLSPHRCVPDCGGAWTYDGDHNVIIVDLPSGVPVNPAQEWIDTF